MDVKELFRSCKKGDLDKVKELIEQREVELNVRDNWDSTPLYYACLCGHTNLVRFLLKCGARCEANTFDGERCVYGALTTEIRSILLNFKVVTSKTIQRNDYDEFLRRAFENGEYSDVTFNVHNVTFKAHRCILSARCEYFSEMFRNKWKNRTNININNHQVIPSTFRILLQYLYTGRLETQLDQVDNFIILVKQCRLWDLLEQIDDAVKKIHSFACTKPGTKVTTILIESSNHFIDFNILIQQALPSSFQSWVGGSELPCLPDLEENLFSDIIFKVDDELFKCHKVFFCSRSDFFKAMIQDHFMEADHHIDGIRVFEIQDLTSDAFARILFFMYQNQCELDMDIVYEILIASDLYLLAGLKKQCANYISEHLTHDNVIPLLRSSRLLELPKLEHFCTLYMATHLEQIISNEEFHLLVKDDAKEVKGREETDTIGIIDDIRYHITNNLQSFSAMDEANDKLALIDELLESFDLDA